jgi:hypothetical protein
MHEAFAWKLMDMATASTYGPPENKASRMRDTRTTVNHLETENVLDSSESCGSGK